MPTGKQIRAARQLVDWSANDLAEKVGVSKESILNIERGDKRARPTTMEKIVKVFETVDVEFKGDHGIDLRDDTVRKIEGPNCYSRLLDEIYYKLSKGDEFFVGMVDESLSSQEVHDAYKRIVKKGIKFKKLIKQGNDYICGPLEWYRQIEPQYYQNAASIFFMDKSAYLTENFEKVLILRDKATTQANKNFFNLIWNHATSPKKTTAQDKYE